MKIPFEWGTMSRTLAVLTATMDPGVARHRLILVTTEHMASRLLLNYFLAHYDDNPLLHWSGTVQ